jgi:photosystem II stability/assembly factor-like uncharacterized protein
MCGFLFLLEFLALTGGLAQEDSLLMAVLNSRKHGWSSTENPIVGMFHSPDAGRTWLHMGWREYIRVFSVVGATDGTLWSACGNGVLRSDDNGVHWKITTDATVTEVLRVSVDPAEPRRVYAATAYGVIRSIDRGESWSTVMNGVATSFTGDVLVDRTDGRHLLLATEGGVYRSRDGGNHWTLAGMASAGIRTIAQDLLDPACFYAGTEEDGVALSTDGGASWHVRSAGLRHRTVYAIACHPEGPDTVYAGTHGGGVYRSTDRGGSWQPWSAGLTTPDIHALVVLPHSPATLFAGTLNGGLFRSTDGGAHWIFDSQEDAQVWGLAVRPQVRP